MSDDRRPFESDASQLDVPRFTQPQPAWDYTPPPAAMPAAPRGSRRRPVRWGRVSAVLFALCLPPMLVGASSARAGAASSPDASRKTQSTAVVAAPEPAATPAAVSSAAPVVAGTHVTLYNGTERTGLEQQAAERLKALGYTVSIASELAGLTPHSFVFHVDHPDSAAGVATSLGLNAPPQAVVADYPPVVEPLAAETADKQPVEVVVILGEDYR